MQKILLFAAVIIAAILSIASNAEAARNCGGASWYSLPGNKTANGERMNPNALTAAHRSLSFGTKLRVTNRQNGRSVVVRINDRGPFVGGRVLDLSKAAASRLGFIGRGHTKVCYRKVS